MDMCPSCGASNPLGAEWCNQCFAALRDIKPEVPGIAAMSVSQTVPSTVAPDAVPGVRPPTTPAASSNATWTCKTCSEVVAISVGSCPSCLTSIYENFGATQNEPLLDEKQLVIKALVPGRAHSIPTSPLAGVVVFMVVSMSLVFGLMMVTTPVRWAGVFVVIWSVAVWAFSIWDARQSYVSSRLLLQPRVTMVVGLVPLIVIIGAVLTTVRS